MRPVRYWGLRSLSGPEYWRKRARFFRNLAAFVGFAFVVDLAGRLFGREVTPRWSTLIGTFVLAVIFATLAYRAARRAERGPDRDRTSDRGIR
jgi:uncharacterized membrane protein YfcA